MSNVAKLREKTLVMAKGEDHGTIPWPTLTPEALHGLPGEFVRAVLPHSESDPAVLLVTYLSAFGNVIGRNAHFRVEADVHHLNIFVNIVGNTGTGRKGVATGHVLQHFHSVDEAWRESCVVSGLASGEGLLYRVRDTSDSDQGVTDKRLWVLESEFASLLRVAGRKDNILSAVIRNLWDRGDHQNMSKQSPIVVTDAHVSITGHIVRYELLSLLSECEAINGFGNRFLWICAKRSKFLPRGGQPGNLAPLIQRLIEAVEFGRNAGEMTLDDQAWTLWDSAYTRLEQGRFGLLGKLTQRASPYTRRLACLYALLDLSNVVRVDHLNAALALWQYAENSARYIFRMRTGDKLVDEILDALRAAGASGLTSTEINNLFRGNKRTDTIAPALQLLEETGQVRSEADSTGKKGRPTQRWFFVGRTEKTEKRTATPDELNSSVYSVTPDMRRRLRECGETDAEIDAMNSSEARALLEYFESFKAVG